MDNDSDDDCGSDSGFEEDALNNLLYLCNIFVTSL